MARSAFADPKNGLTRFGRSLKSAGRNCSSAKPGVITGKRRLARAATFRTFRVSPGMDNTGWPEVCSDIPSSVSSVGRSPGSELDGGATTKTAIFDRRGASPSACLLANIGFAFDSNSSSATTLPWIAAETMCAPMRRLLRVICRRR
jgi:hypothetical protein